MAVVSFPYAARKRGSCGECNKEFVKDELIRYYNGVGGARVLREHCCGHRFSVLTSTRSAEDDYDLMLDLGGEFG